jgi:hypothetical protein
MFKRSSARPPAPQPRTKPTITIKRKRFIPPQ